MIRIDDAGHDPDPRPRSTVPANRQTEADRPPAGPQTFAIPPLLGSKTLAGIARSWHRLHPGLPLIPLRRPVRGEAAPKRGRWVPLDGCWDEPPETGRLADILKGQADPGIGLRLGRWGEASTWLVDVLLKNIGPSTTAWSRRLGDDDRYRTASWQDEHGTHRIFVGDDRLARFGPGVIGDFKGNGGDPDFAGVEIRLGSTDPATSLAVLPPTSLDDGKPRRVGGDRRFSPLPEEVYAALERSQGARYGGFEVVGSPGAAPEGIASPVAARTPSPSPGVGHSPGPKPVGKAIALSVPANLLSAVAPVLEPDDAEGPEPPSSPSLSDLAVGINRSHRRWQMSASDALRHARRAGEGLIQAKARLEHGLFQAWVRDNCPFCYRTAAGYMEICRRWPEVEELLESKVQREALLTLSGTLRMLARAQTASAGGRDRPDVGAIDASVPEGLDRLPVEADFRSSSGQDGEPGRTVGGPPRPRERREGDSPASTVANLGAGTPARMAASGDALAPGDVEFRRAGPPSANPAADADAPVGVATSEGTRARAEDLAFLNRPGPIRALREQLANPRDFDADATLWRLLRPLAPEIQIRGKLAGGEHGLHAPDLVKFVLAKSPGEWELCPACRGLGRPGPDGGGCARCSGGGYLVTSRPG